MTTSFIPPGGSKPQLYPGTNARISDLQPSGYSIEDQVRFNYHTPAPNTYNPELPPKKVESGPYGMIQPGYIPSFTEVGESRFVPGPGSYQVVSESALENLPQGGRYFPKDVEKVYQSKGLVGPKLAARMLKQYSGSKHPDPTRYFPELHNPKLKVLSANGGKLGKFSREPRFPKPFKDPNNQVPPVGEYETLHSQEFLDPFLPSGGKGITEQYKPQTSYFDEVTYPTKDNPGPGKYNPSMPGGNRIDFSQAVYSHTTETMEESKKLVKKVTSGSNDVPGPGHYSLPQLPSIQGAPKMAGKTLPYAVPKPFSYNAQPDFCKKYSNNFHHIVHTRDGNTISSNGILSQPILRSSNSGDLIFGRNFKAGHDYIRGYPSNQAGQGGGSSGSNAQPGLSRSGPGGNLNGTGTTTNGSPPGSPPFTTGMPSYDQRRAAEKEQKKLKSLEDEQIILDDQRVKLEANAHKFDPDRPKWIEGGFEIHENDDSFIKAGTSPLADRSQQTNVADNELAIANSNRRKDGVVVHRDGDDNNGNNGNTINGLGIPSTIPQDNISRRPRRDLLTASFDEIVRDEHPAVLRAAGNYQRLSGRAYKPTKQFLPLAAKRPVRVNAAEDSTISTSYDVNKKSYLSVCDSLHVATDDLVGHMKTGCSMEVRRSILDKKDGYSMEELLYISESSLRDKAQHKMVLDGLQSPACETILSELPRLFEKPSGVKAREEAEKKFKDEQEKARVRNEQYQKDKEESEQQMGAQNAIENNITSGITSPSKTNNLKISPSTSPTNAATTGQNNLNINSGSGSASPQVLMSPVPSPTAAENQPSPNENDPSCKDQLDPSGNLVVSEEAKDIVRRLSELVIAANTSDMAKLQEIAEGAKKAKEDGDDEDLDDDDDDKLKEEGTTTKTAEAERSESNVQAPTKKLAQVGEPDMADLLLQAADEDLETLEGHAKIVGKEKSLSDKYFVNQQTASGINSDEAASAGPDSARVSPNNDAGGPGSGAASGKASDNENTSNVDNITANSNADNADGNSNADNQSESNISGTAGPGPDSAAASALPTPNAAGPNGLLLETPKVGNQTNNGTLSSSLSNDPDDSPTHRDEAGDTVPPLASELATGQTLLDSSVLNMDMPSLCPPTPTGPGGGPALDTIPGTPHAADSGDGDGPEGSEPGGSQSNSMTEQPIINIDDGDMDVD